MERLTAFLYGYFRDLVASSVTPWDYFWQVFDWNPWVLWDWAKPILYVEPWNTNLISSHSTYDKYSIDCTIGVSIPEKVFSWASDQNVVLLKRKLQMILEKVEWTNAYSKDSIVGQIMCQKCFVDKETWINILDDVNVIWTTYWSAQRQRGPVAYEWIVTIQWRLNIFRSCT